MIGVLRFMGSARPEDVHNAARIVQCVNDCDGISDPLATFRRARNAIESLRTALRRHAPDGFDSAALDEGLEALKAISKGTKL